jgi:phage-related protein
MTIDTALMELKPLYSVGQSKKDHAAFPEDVHDAVGYALHKAQGGDKHPSAKPLKGFSGAGVLEVVEDHAGDTFRAVYTERFEGAIYVLHAFQKKAKKGSPRRNRKSSWSSDAWQLPRRIMRDATRNRRNERNGYPHHGRQHL